MTLSEPRFENSGPLLIAGLRSHFTAAPWEGIPAQWQRFGSYLGRIPGQIGRTTYGLCFNVANGVDYLSGVEVSSASNLPDEFSVVSIPALKYAIFPHYEHVSKLYETCEGIEHQWLPASGHQAAKAIADGPDFFERYGENFDAAAGPGDVEVWVPIKF